MRKLPVVASFEDKRFTRHISIRSPAYPEKRQGGICRIIWTSQHLPDLEPLLALFSMEALSQYKAWPTFESFV